LNLLVPENSELDPRQRDRATGFACKGEGVEIEDEAGEAHGQRRFAERL